MMAEKVRLFQDHDAAEQLMALPDPREHKRLGRGEHNFDYLGPCSGRRRSRCFFCQIHAEPGHEAAPIEHWRQTFG